MLDRRAAMFGSLAVGLAARGSAQTRPPSPSEHRRLTWPDPTETIDLWPQGAPGAPPQPLVETVTERSTDLSYNDRFVVGISRPRMAVFRPERPNGAAVLIMPGGGYRWVVVDKEGYEMGRWLSARGVTAFVLFYRLPNEGWASGPDTPLADAQRAMRLVRHRANVYGVDSARLCAMGFSAGGHVCASLLTRFAASVYQPIDAADRQSARPAAAAPIYPVISMTGPNAHPVSRQHLIGSAAPAERELKYTPSSHVPADAPPVFLLHAEDDQSVPVENSLMLRAALLAQRVPVETHLFPDGGHGFGLRLAQGKSVEGWETLFYAWVRRQGLIP